MRFTLPRTSAAVTAGLVLVLAPAAASATPNFPAEIESQLMLTYTPPCAVCHTNGVTNATTVTTPFGMAMRGVGLQPNDLQSLDKALAALEKAGTDSDGDGTPDIEELRTGKDPNTTGGSLAEGPIYGCGAQSPTKKETPMSAAFARGSTTPWFLAGATAAVLAFVMRRRRR